MNIDNWITAVLALRKAQQVVVFSGAGISAESGIPTFRDSDGFWQRFPPERFASWKGLIRAVLTDAPAVAEFVLQVVEPIAKAAPNQGHLAVAQLETHVPTIVVTQNIDGLHQSAGSTNVFEIHGSVLEVIHRSTGKIVHRFQRAELAQLAESLRKYSAKQQSLIAFLLDFQQHYPLNWLGRHRPNLILFGDTLAEPAWSQSCQAVDACDVLISVGTSGSVYPAAALPDRAIGKGATVITVDPNASGECWLEGRAETVLPKLIQDAFGNSHRSDRTET